MGDSNYSKYEIDNDNAQDKKRFIRNMFDSITGPYDLLNRVLSMGIDVGWRRNMIKIAGPLKDKKALDICCGTGDVSALLHKKGADVTSLDFSENMLRLGLKKQAIQGAPIAADASKMPFAPSSFDAATIAFGIRNVPDMDCFMDEAARVLKPGGRLVILELTRPANRLIYFFHSIYLQKIMPFVGGMISGKKSAYDYLAGTISTFVDPKTLQKMLEEKTFENVAIFPQTFGVATLIVCQRPLS